LDDDKELDKQRAAMILEGLHKEKSANKQPKKSLPRQATQWVLCLFIGSTSELFVISCSSIVDGRCCGHRTMVVVVLCSRWLVVVVVSAATRKNLKQPLPRFLFREFRLQTKTLVEGTWKIEVASRIQTGPLV
jgi:hypothetical protein